jgi:hypothetical protein
MTQIERQDTVLVMNMERELNRLSFRGRLAESLKQITIILLVSLSCCSCVEEPEPPFRVGTNFWPGYELFYLARDLGYYDRAIALSLYSH